MGQGFAKVKEEFQKLLPPTIYFFITLHLVALVRSLLLRGTGIELVSSLAVTIAALTLGKTVLIVDVLPFMNRYPDKPLAYNVVWTTTIYFVVATFIHYLERLYDVWKDAASLSAANDSLLAQMIWPHFWGTEIVVFLIIFMYCVARELVRAVGAKKAREMFFGPPANVQA
jgi:hypothetical protein